MPEAGPGDGTHGPQDLQCFCTVASTPWYRSEASRNLSILRASKILYIEVMEELYRNRVLTVCFNWQCHAQGYDYFDHPRFYTKIGGICREHYFHHIDFSKFWSLKLNIRLPGRYAGCGSFTNVIQSLTSFARLVRAWQDEKYQDSKPSFPRVDVALDCSPYKSNEPRSELCLEEVASVLDPITTIPNIEDASIEIRVSLRFGQEWLPGLKRQLVANIRSNSQQYRRSGGRIRKALQESRKLTRMSMGSGALPTAPGYQKSSIPSNGLLNG
ncbi:MAG: hypothetical protein L6R41_007908 [Letrouitia leprolyta]|nr:MAG: hypothetical protein L6R41_007908 [Letrouitia leprolyta]